MNVTIPNSLEAPVRERVAKEHCSAKDEVFVDTLHLMQARDEAIRIKRARLKDAVDRGYQDSHHGSGHRPQE